MHTGLGTQQLVFAVHHAHVDAYLPRRSVVRRDLHAGAGIAGILDRHPGMLQEHALLRIQHVRVDWRDVEEQRIEFVDASDETAPFAVVAAWSVAILAVVIAPVPAFGRNLGNAVFAVAQHRPERLNVLGLGIAATEADDGDRFVLMIVRQRVGLNRRGGASFFSLHATGRR
ncbi:hypothetical protein GCM10027565_15960 [Bordetella tumulicola]